MIKFAFAPIAHRDVPLRMPAGDGVEVLTIRADLRTSRLVFAGRSDREIFHDVCAGIRDIVNAQGVSVLELSESASPAQIRDALVPSPVVGEGGVTTYPDAGVCDWIVVAVAIYASRDFSKALLGN